MIDCVYTVTLEFFEAFIFKVITKEAIAVVDAFKETPYKLFQLRKHYSANALRKICTSTQSGSLSNHGKGYMRLAIVLQKETTNIEKSPLDVGLYIFYKLSPATYQQIVYIEPIEKPYRWFTWDGAILWHNYLGRVVKILAELL